MQYHVLTTERCNMHCSYCGGTRHLPGIPLDISYDIDRLKEFISKDPDAVIGFYGGEPLMAMNRVEEIMDTVPARAFTLQTNGTLLNELKEEYLQRIHSILVSLDGPKGITDKNRGSGTYDLVMSNVEKIKKRGFKGDLIARMAFSDEGEIYRDVSHLLEDFDHVHWQLDVFWSELDQRKDIKEWLDRYDKGIQCLISDFGNGLEEGDVLGMVPFIPVLRTLLTGKPHHIWCGSGIDSFSIMTSGSIEACPIAPELLYSNMGNIEGSTPDDIRGARPVGPPCTECDILWVCGGRCLYANQTMGWGRELFDRVCLSTRRMVEGLNDLLPLVEEGTISVKDLDYPKLNNGCEIIP